MNKSEKDNEKAFHKKPEENQPKTFVEDKEQVMSMRISRNGTQHANVLNPTGLNDSNKKTIYVERNGENNQKDFQVKFEPDLKKEGKYGTAEGRGNPLDSLNFWSRALSY